MKNILLANLGNRNVYYQTGEGDFITIADYVKAANLKSYILLNETFLTEQYDFRSFTRDIWEQIEAGVFDLSLIDARVLTVDDLTEREYKCVYLFYTDQQGTTVQYQDTIFEGLILQHLFKKALPDLAVELILISGNPANEQNLYQQYSLLLKTLLATHPDCQFIFHDVGGTPQMKVVAKTLLEYHLRQQSRTFTVRYKDYLSENARESDRTLHSRYLLLDVAREFIQQFQFKAAADLLNRIADTDPAIERLRYHTQLADVRLNFRHRPTPADYAAKVLKPIPIFEAWTKKQIPNSFITDLPQTERHNLFEFAAICSFYFQQLNYTLGVATYYRLCEELCLAFVRAENIYSLESKKKRDAFAISVYPQVSAMLTGSAGPQYGVPLLLAYVRKKAHTKQLRSIYELMLPTISHVNGTTDKGMNYLRNECWLAHNNYAISNKEIHIEVPGFLQEKKGLEQLLKCMGLPTENIFVSIQKALLSELSFF